MLGSRVLLCLCSMTCCLTMLPAAGNTILHFGPCRISMSMSEIRAGFTAIKTNIVSPAVGSWGAACVPIALWCQRVPHCMSFFHTASPGPHQDAEHPVPPTLSAQGPGGCPQRPAMPHSSLLTVLRAESCWVVRREAGALGGRGQRRLHCSEGRKGKEGSLLVFLTLPSLQGGVLRNTNKVFAALLLQGTSLGPLLHALTPSYKASSLTRSLSEAR